MEPVAAGDDGTGDFMLRAVMAVANARMPGLEVMYADVQGVEHDLPACGDARGDEVLHHLVLAVDHHVLADEVRQVDAMVCAAEPHDHAGMQHALAPHTLADTGLVQQLLSAVFQHAGTDAVLDML